MNILFISDDENKQQKAVGKFPGHKLFIRKECDLYNALHSEKMHLVLIDKESIDDALGSGLMVRMVSDSSEVVVITENVGGCANESESSLGELEKYNQAHFAIDLWRGMTGYTGLIHIMTPNYKADGFGLPMCQTL